MLTRLFEPQRDLTFTISYHCLLYHFTLYNSRPLVALNLVTFWTEIRNKNKNCFFVFFSNSTFNTWPTKVLFHPWRKELIKVTFYKTLFLTLWNTPLVFIKYGKLWVFFPTGERWNVEITSHLLLPFRIIKKYVLIS